MMDESRHQKIIGLKDMFERIDQITHGAQVWDDDRAAKLTAIHLAILAHTLDTFETSLDQISICLEISKMIFFYADDIVENPEFWQEENNVNRMLATNNFKMIKADMAFSGQLLDREVKSLETETVPDQAVVLETIGHLHRYEGLAKRFHEVVQTLTDQDQRRQSSMDLYDVEQRPDLGNKTAEQVLKHLNLQSSQNADHAMSQNIETATDLVAAFAIPVNPQHGLLNDQLALVLNRFEALEDTVDNRYGFTQLRFE